VIQERLSAQGLVYRYLTDDGLPGIEATFRLCTFWLVDNLALSGRIAEARELFDRVSATPMTLACCRRRSIRPRASCSGIFLRALRISR